MGRPMIERSEQTRREPEGSKITQESRLEGCSPTGTSPWVMSTSLEADCQGCAIAMPRCESAPRRGAVARVRGSRAARTSATSRQRVDRCLRAGAVGKGPKEV